jgi:lipopolysaccharide export system protein LptA
MKRLKNRALFILCMVCYTAPSLAERADREQPLHLEADRVQIEDAKQSSSFEGNVLLSQGTLSIRADKLVVSQDKEGFKHSTSTGHPATFRQKREGLNEYVEGFAERIEYDTRADMLELFGQARIKREQDDLSGEHILYNSKTEVLQVSGATHSSSAPSTGRVRVIIQPKAPPRAASGASTDTKK